MAPPPFKRRALHSASVRACCVQFVPVVQDPEIDPLTGGPWDFPYVRRWISLDEFKRQYPLEADALLVQN